MGKHRSTGRKLSGTNMSVLGVGVGVSTSPAATDRDIVQGLATFLEDRRVLFNPDYLEVEWQVDDSVQEIRKQLTETLQQLPDGDAANAIRAMREACRRYLDNPRQHFRHLERHGPHPREAGAGFFLALGELRGVFGAEMKRLDDLFQLKIEKQLRDLFPVSCNGE